MFMAKWIPKWAARAFFLVIFLQLNLFRAPCRTGVCTTPMHVTVGQMAASEITPSTVLKGLLYPGAVLRHLYNGDAIAPVWDNLLREYNLTESNLTDLDSSTAVRRFRLEVVAGSYFAVGGAIVSLVNPGRMGMFGILMVIWGLVKDGLFQRPAHIEDDPTNLVHAYPMLFLGLALALLSVRYDMKKVQKLGAPIAKPMSNSTKSKLKTK